jgi:hypothetical protein
LLKITLDNIKDIAKPEILNLGRRDYIDGLVKSMIFHIERMEFSAKVGSSVGVHNVVLSINSEGDIVGTSCDCLYSDKGAFLCRHRVAALLALSEADKKGSLDRMESRMVTREFIRHLNSGIKLGFDSRELLKLEVTCHIDRYYTVKALDGSGNEVKGIDVSPERIRVRLDLVAVPARKSVFVSPTIVGQPQYPYKVTRVSVVPETVIIVGKPAMLLDISTIGTEDVTIDGAVQNISRDVELRLPPDVDISGSKKVRVNVRIELRQDQT